MEYFIQIKLKMQPFNYFLFITWIIHESMLLQMQGAGHEVVVLHYECPVTKQMLQDRLA
jgi:hypothetical protein